MKRLSIMLLATLLLLTTVVGGSMAYFNDSIISPNNVITSGNIQIIQYVQERVVGSDGKYSGLQRYTQYQEIAPLVQTSEVGYDTVTVGSHQVSLRDSTAQNYVDKIVTVKNTGVNPAYVRTFIAVPTGGHKSSSPTDDNWLHLASTWDAEVADANGNPIPSGWSINSAQNTCHMIDDASINGVEYDIYVATYTTMLQPGETSAPSLLGFWLDSSVSNDEMGHFFTTSDREKVYLNGLSTMEILVATEAVQTTTFDDPWTALDTVFGEASITNNPWTNNNTIYVSSTDELTEALASSNIHSGSTIRLTDGTYDLPGTLPNGIRIVGHGPNIIVNAPESITASGVEFFNVTFANDVTFVGNGEFDMVTFQGKFTAAFNNPAYITDCVFKSDYSWNVTEDAARSTIVFENCTDEEGNPLTVN